MTGVRRVRATFGMLVGISIVAIGVLGRAITWSASPLAGTTVAVSAITALLAGALALRILVVIDRRR